MNNVENIVKLAEKFVGVPYKYGALMDEAPNVFDCSGFIKYIFNTIDIDLPRSTIEQASQGVEIKIDDIQPSDLVFMHGNYGHYNPNFPQGIGHVGIYIGNNEIIHAASERLSEKPIIEKGAVVKSTMDEFIKGWAPVVVIKRVLYEK